MADRMETSWRQVVTDAREWVADAIASGDLDLNNHESVDEWVHETADGSGHVIYTARSRALWTDPCSPDVDPGDIEPPTTDPDRLVTVAAYLIVERALWDAIEDARREVTP